MSASRHYDKRGALYEAIGRNLVRLRQASGHTVGAVCKGTGMAEGSLQKLEEGITVPLHRIAVLADFYQVSIADIVPSLRELAA